MHSRQTRKSKGKLSARDKRQAEENEKNLEDQFSKAGDVGNCVAGGQQEGGGAEMRGPEPEVRAERQSGVAVQNGPAGYSRAQAVPRHSGPGEDAEVAAEPAPEDN
jgi:hypothetical protein